LFAVKIKRLVSGKFVEDLGKQINRRERKERRETGKKMKPK